MCSVGSSAVSGGAGGSAGGAGNAPGGMLEVVSVSTTEEVIDFEEWMVDTVSQSRCVDAVRTVCRMV